MIPGPDFPIGGLRNSRRPDTEDSKKRVGYRMAGMDVLHLQAMLGHVSLDMVQNHAQMADDDLLQSHHAHSPIDQSAYLR